MVNFCNSLLRCRVKLNCFFNFQIEEIYRYRLGDVGFPISQGSPYRIFLDQAIKDITEDGQLERMQKIWTKPKPDCSPILLEGKVLTVEKLAGPFLVFVLGLALTLFVAVAEMVISNVTQTKHRKRSINTSSKSKLVVVE